MERAKEISTLEERNGTEIALSELNELQLALIGGGSADPIYH